MRLRLAQGIDAMKKVFGGGSWTTRSQPKAPAADPDGLRAASSDVAASSKHGRSAKDDAPSEAKPGNGITPYVSDGKSGDETPRASDETGDPGASVSSDGGGDGDRFRYTCVRQVRRPGGDFGARARERDPTFVSRAQSLGSLSGPLRSSAVSPVRPPGDRPIPHGARARGGADAEKAARGARGRARARRLGDSAKVGP